MVTVVVVRLVVVVVADVVIVAVDVEVKETVLDVDGAVVEVVILVVSTPEEVAVELDVPEIDMEGEDEALDAEEVDDEAVRVPLVAVAVLVMLSLEASGNNAPTLMARMKTTTTATVAPAAICLLYSDNRGPVLPAVDIVLCFRMVLP